MWREALGHIVGAWTEDEYQADGKHWKMGAPRRVLPKPLQQPHPPIFGATSSLPGHKEIGTQGIGLCSFTVGLPPEQLEERIAMYREGLAECEKPAGKFVNDTAATFTMVHCAPTSGGGHRGRQGVASSGTRATAAGSSRRSRSGRRSAASPAPTSAPTSTPATCSRPKREGVMSHITIDYLRDSGSAVMGDPDQCIESAKRYEAVGCDLLLCLVNPLKIPHEKVMQSIELMGKYVLPEFK